MKLIPYKTDKDLKKKLVDNNYYIIYEPDSNFFHHQGFYFVKYLADTEAFIEIYAMGINSSDEICEWNLNMKFPFWVYVDMLVFEPTDEELLGHIMVEII